MDSCREDVKRLSSIFKNINADCYESFNCHPENEISRFIQSKQFYADDVVIIHYSGHGRRVGRKINNKMQLISTWLAPNMKTHIFSHDIDALLSTLPCKILLISDSCHSGRFGDFYTGNNLIFIGSSSINTQIRAYSFSTKKKAGILVNLFEYILLKESLKTLSFENLEKYAKDFYKEKMIKTKPILKDLVYHQKVDDE